ncbi:MAG: alkene reductase [Myxococcota bacterium]|nr:alkene reductase [Myxococcota bacterium]
MSELLFSSYELGPVELANRVVMAPMTRSRSLGNVPGELVATYYAQRAEAGLIVTEGTSPSPHGLGYPRIPGIFSPEQVQGWRGVTEAVHAAGSKIFVQLMHTGRVGHPGNLPAGARLLAPSPVAAPGQMYVDGLGQQEIPLPAALTEEEIASSIAEFATAARLAREAGFDGVELHGANGYLIDQFLNVASNHRQDGWGGTVAGRIRFALAVAEASALAIGANRVGIRLSPYGVFNGMVPDPETAALYTTLAHELARLGLAYVHLVDHSSLGAPPVDHAVVQAIRQAFPGTLILSGGYDRERAERDLAARRGDLIAFGRPWIANPRLVTKLRQGAPLVQPDFGTFYTPGEQGYTDYPSE